MVGGSMLGGGICAIMGLSAVFGAMGVLA
jgi:hypothetical protein